MNNEQIHGHPITHEGDREVKRHNLRHRLIQVLGVLAVTVTAVTGVSKLNVGDALTPDLDFSHVGDNIVKHKYGS